MAKKDIILSGVGGQGILSIATVIGWAALDQNLHLKQAEVHGMSQRGGDVQSNLRISTDTIWSDLIPEGECDLILSLEPMEALRYLPWLSKGGWIVTNSTPFVNIPNYPPVEEIANSYKGVERTYAIQAGREVRVMVEPDTVDEAATTVLAHDIAQRIENEMQYPGQVKVVVIRESRAVGIAK